MNTFVLTITGELKDALKEEFPKSDDPSREYPFNLFKSFFAEREDDEYTYNLIYNGPKDQQEEAEAELENQVVAWQSYFDCRWDYD